MSLVSTSVQPQEIPLNPNTPDPQTAAVLGALILSVYAAQKSRKQLRKLKRKALLTFMKLRITQSVKSFFSKTKRDGISTRTLLYILLGLIVLILLFTLPPLVAIVVLLIGILLLLLWKPSTKG